MLRALALLVGMVATMAAITQMGGQPGSLAQQVPCVGDVDCDGMSDAYEDAHACLDKFTPDAEGDPDGDLLTSIQERDFLTDPCERDTDDDGCSDAEELGDDPQRGGKRDPNDYWDFYDVAPAPAPGPGNDRYVDLSDTLVILHHFGHAPDFDPFDVWLDRTWYDRANQPWRSVKDTDGLDLGDALVNLAQYGASCIAPG